MVTVTQRQEEILRSIVERYVKTAMPVGSLVLAREFGCSSATIRAEMARLEMADLITHPHTSAGRIPTDKGYRFYVDALLDAEVVVKRDRQAYALEQRIVSAGEPERAVRSAAETLVELTGNVAVANTGETLYMTGLASALAQPEFQQVAAVRELAYLLDNIEPWLRETSPVQTLAIYIGNENPIGKSSGCSLVIGRFRSPYSGNSYLGIVGPTRQSYRRNIEYVKRATQQLEEVLHE